MKLFTLDEIQTIFSSQSIEFETQGACDSSASFRLASIKKIIDGGLYYVVGPWSASGKGIQSGVVICDEWPSNSSKDIVSIKVDDAQLRFYQLSTYAEFKSHKGIHPTAILQNVKLGERVSIGPYCVLNDCELGNDVKLSSHVVVEPGSIIGDRVEIQPHTCIGARGMAWIWGPNGERIIQPQLGGVIIEDDCLIGSDITIVRGSLSENTVVGRGTVMAHGTKLGHGAQVGAYGHFANNVSLAGNAVLGEAVFLGSGSIVSSNVSIAAGCIVGAGAVVTKSVDEANATLAGVPAQIIKRHNYESKPKGAPKPKKSNYGKN